MKTRLLLRCALLPCLLLCMGSERCDYGFYTKKAFLVNQTDSPLEVLASKPTVPCVEVASHQIPDLTQSDFKEAEPLSFPPHSISLFPEGNRCETDILWLRIGEFSGIVRWSFLESVEVPEDISNDEKPRAIFVEGRKNKLVVSVGHKLELFPAPPKGPPALRSDTLEFAAGATVLP